jgi:hypothetical protein
MNAEKWWKSLEKFAQFSKKVRFLSFETGNAKKNF